MSPTLTDFHAGTNKNYHPTTTVHQQEPDPLSPHFHLVASTRQIPGTWFTPESSLLFFNNTGHNNGSKNWAMVVVATNTFATSMQHYPSQPHLSRGTQFLIKTVSIGLSHMETPTWFLQAPLKQYFPTFHYRTPSFCFLLIFSSLEPSKPPPNDKRDFSGFWEASSQVIFPFQRKFQRNFPTTIPPKRYIQFQWPNSQVKVEETYEPNCQ